MWTGSPRTGLNPVRNVASKNIFKPNLCPPHPTWRPASPIWPLGAFSRAPAQERARSSFPPTSSINGKGTPDEEAYHLPRSPPFAAFSDEQLDRLTARPDVDVLDCRGGAVDDPPSWAAQSADIVISERSPSRRRSARRPAHLRCVAAPERARHDRHTCCRRPGITVCTLGQRRGRGAHLRPAARPAPASPALRCRDARQREQGAILGREVQGRTFGIVGMGAIGRCVASIAQGFEAASLVSTPTGRKPSPPNGYRAP